MRIIDACVGLGPWGWRKPISPGDSAEILAIMDYCGIESAVAFSNLNYANPTDALASVQREINGSPRFRPSYLLAPRTYDGQPGPEDYAAAMRAAGAKVAWLRPAWQSHEVKPWVIGDLLAMCVAHRLPLFVPLDGGVSLDDAHQFCSLYPELRLVLANIGYRADPEVYALLRRHRQLRVCLGHTYCNTLAPERFVQHFGPERLIYGSSLPTFSPGGLIGMVMYSRLSDADKQLILAGNIERLMNEVQL